jgi:hypothetical protein
MIENISINDDMTMDAAEYPAQVDAFAPPAPGNYRFKVGEYDWQRDQNGNVQLTDGRYPTLVINDVTIVEGLDEPKKVAVYQRIRVKPFERFGRRASEFNDFLRAFDDTVSYGSWDEAQALMRELFETQTFRGQLNWTAYDKKFVEQCFNAIGGKVNASDEQSKDIYKNARVNSYKRFPTMSNGKPSHIWVGPSGEAIPAKPFIGRFIASSDDKKKLGAFVA